MPEEGRDQEMFSDAYEALGDNPSFGAYMARHGVEAQPVLTVTDDETAHAIAGFLDPIVAGKTVVEVGGGIGLLAMHLGFSARHVFCIEANPVWASSFVTVLLDHKPKNVSYLFGAADEFVGHIKADVALFLTHSGVDSMRAVSSRFAPLVVDVYGDIIARNPAAFDKLARQMRLVV